MSGSTIGGFVGAGIGFLVGGPAGARWGWMIGSAVGGYVDPAQVEGPRLQDARVQTSRDGVPIPFGWGTFPVAGNIIAQGPVVERKKSERQGKGGPEVTNYTYTRTYAIGLCEGPITGVLQVKRNGKVVYDARTDEDLAADIARELSGVELTGFMGSTFIQIAAAIRAANARFDNKVTFYLGDETQMPDPALEAIFGAGKVPAHRGLAYFVVEDDDVTDTAGAIPQFEVVVAQCGEGGGSSIFGAGWNANDMGHNGHLLDFGQTFTATPSGDVCDPAVRSISSFSEGKVYWEIHVRRVVDADTGFAGCSVGFADGTSTVECLDMAGRSDMQWGWLRNGSLVRNVTVGTLPFGKVGPTWGEGDTLMFAIDLTTNKLWLGVNGVWHNSGDPSAGLNPTDNYDQTYSSHVPLYALAKIQHWPSGPQTELTLHDHYGLFTYAAPTGFAALTGGIAGVEIPDAPGYYVDENGELTTDQSPYTLQPCTGVALSTIFGDVCERSGIDASEYDASELTDLVPGFVVGRETDGASILQSLSPAYFFDTAEWDGKLRGKKRGGTAVASINGDDLVERDGDAFERKRVQEAELLRRVTVAYNDPMAGYAPTTQKWERRAGTVQALGEASVELPLTLAADDAATIAKRRGLTAWGEPEKQKFSLPYRLAALTPTDVINYTDDDGQVHTLRLMDLQDDSGVRYVESSVNRAEAYGATASGVVPAGPSLTDPSLRGPTLLAVMDLPLWRNSDADTLGLYVAARGYMAGWQGAVVAVSTDAGVSYTDVTQITQQAAIGATTTALVADVSSEYPSGQSLTVTLPRAPESVAYETLLRYNNRAALQLDSGAWEILQYQTVVAVDETTFTLSGLVRGRYATTPGAAAIGARFVLLDAAVQFVPVERHLLGETVKARATTFGTSSDAAVPVDVTFTAGASQTEWPVHGVTATRDVSGNVTVTWIGRARLGVETAPYHSANFAGYRVSWDDGSIVTTADTTDSTYTITAAADPIDVTVTPLNSITGAGPASEAITV